MINNPEMIDSHNKECHYCGCMMAGPCRTVACSLSNAAPRAAELMLRSNLITLTSHSDCLHVVFVPLAHLRSPRAFHHRRPGVCL